MEGEYRSMDLKNKPARPHLANPAKEAAVGMDVKNKPARPRKPSTPRRRRTSGQTIAGLITAITGLIVALAALAHALLGRA